MRLLIMGPPGAGKGTQGIVVADQFGIPAISTGSIFRDHVSRQTELGQQVSAIMAAGGLVPDALTIQIVADRLSNPDTAPGWLLDGFPRTVFQAEALDGILAAAETPIDAVLVLTVDTEQLIERLLKRAELEHRVDDNDATIRQRLEVYRAETEPLLALYGDRGLLVEVDGLGEVNEVTERIRQALAPGVVNL
jgi:adenylate kinase